MHLLLADCLKLGRPLRDGDENAFLEEYDSFQQTVGDSENRKNISQLEVNTFEFVFYFSFLLIFFFFFF